MNEFMMIFRYEPQPENATLTEEAQQASIRKWQDWIGGIAAQGKFKHTAQLGTTGKTLHASHMTTDGPYAELKEIVGGYIMVTADSLEDALTLAAGCPILEMGGKLEIREVLPV